MFVYLCIVYITFNYFWNLFCFFSKTLANITYIHTYSYTNMRTNIIICLNKQTQLYSIPQKTLNDTNEYEKAN